MNLMTLDQVITAAGALPLEDQRRLREWLEEQERASNNRRRGEDHVRLQIERFRKAQQWVDEHRAEYQGQWVALDGDRLISHGADVKQVYEQAKAAGIQTPFIERVEQEDDRPFCGGWLP